MGRRVAKHGKPGELEIVEAEAEIVRRIFTEYVGGWMTKPAIHPLR